MKAGTKAQTEAIEKWKSQGNRYDYNSAVEHLKEIGLYDDNGYKYGHGWLYQPIPKSVIFELKEAIENIKAKKYKFGGYMEEGGEVNEDNMEMVVSQIKAIKHHAEEVSDIINRSTPIEAWVVAKIERAETDLSDVTHYLDGIKN